LVTFVIWATDGAVRAKIRLQRTGRLANRNIATSSKHKTVKSGVAARVRVIVVRTATATDDHATRLILQGNSEEGLTELRSAA
jgi:hypothetical protein